MYSVSFLPLLSEPVLGLYLTMKCENLILSVAVLLNTVGSGQSLNILAIFPYPGKSHFIVFREYLQELARRGHNLTVISHFPQLEPTENYYDIKLTSTAKPLPSSGINEFPIFNRHLTILYSRMVLMNSGRDDCEVLLANKEVQELITKKQRFDVVVVEQFNSDCALGVAYKFQAPIIGATSHMLLPWQFRRFGIPDNPSFTPFIYAIGGTKPTLFQRVESAIITTYAKLIYYYLGQRSDQRTLARYFDDIPPLESLAREVKFLLLYNNFILTGSRLLPANVIEVGGYHVAKTKPLPKALQMFMDHAEYGVVYISFGTVIKNSTFTTDKVEAILGAMENLPQRFVWKWDQEIVRFNKSKLYVSNWLPQNDILGHRKTLSFFSHAGMAGCTEGIHHGVPMIAMPIYGDQPGNAAMVEESGLGTTIQIENLTEENLLMAFKKILNPKFRENVKVLSRAWHDRPQSPLDTAVYWTEFAARYPNFTFRAPSADVPLYQYYNLDIILVLILANLIMFVVIKTTKNICIKYCKSKYKIKKIN